MRKLLFAVFALALPAFSQVIDPRTQINWPRVSGNGSPLSAGFACTASNYGQMYTDKSGPHYWTCASPGGTPTWYQVDSAGGSSTILQVNGTPTTPVSPVNFNDTTPAAPTGFQNCKFQQDGTADVSCYVPASNPPSVQDLVVPPDSNQGIFIPFTVCTKVPDNVSLLVTQTCKGDSGYQQTIPGGNFNHNAHPSIIFSVPDPTLVAALSGKTIGSIFLAAWSRLGGTTSGTVSCSATGLGTTLVPISVPSGSQSTVSVPSLTGPNVSTTTCTLNQSQSVNGDYGDTQMYQLGLWVEYTGTPITPTNALNAQYPLVYSLDGNALTVSPFFPDYLFPRLFANLPSSDKWQFNQAGYPTFVVSDNDTTTIGNQCHGTGTSTGPPYSLCQMDGTGGWLYAGTFGGSGPPAVSSVDSPLASLSISPSAGAVHADINLGHFNHWSANQQFDAGINLGGAHSEINLNGSGGASGDCLKSSGGGNTPFWSSSCGGGGTVGPGTVGFLPKFSTTTTIGDSHIDDGATTSGHVTITEPVDVSSTGPSQFGFTYNGTPLVPGSATTAVYGVNSSGQAVASEAAGAASRICTAANAATNTGCQGSSSSVSVNGSSVSSPNFNGTTPAAGSNGKNVTWQASGSSVSAEIVGDGNATHYLDGTGNYSTPAGGGGGGYTNVTGSASETTVALINTACGSGTYYATTPLSIATGGTITCPVQFSKAGLWTIASGQTVTFSKPVSETDAPAQHFAGSGVVVFPLQNNLRAEWWGYVADGNLGSNTGTDNYPAVQAAITAMTAGTLNFPCGFARFTSGTPTVSGKSNIQLKGCVLGGNNTNQTTWFASTSTLGNVKFAGSSGAHDKWNGIDSITFARAVAPSTTAGQARGLDVEWNEGFVWQNSRVEDAGTQATYWLFPDGAFSGHTSYVAVEWGFNGISPAAGTYSCYYIDGSQALSSWVTDHRGCLTNNKADGTHIFYGDNYSGPIMEDVMSDWFQTFQITTSVFANVTPTGGFQNGDIHYVHSVFDTNKGSVVNLTGLTSGGANVNFDEGWCTNSGTPYGFEIHSSQGIHLSNFELSQCGTTASAYFDSSTRVSFTNNHCDTVISSFAGCLKVNATSASVFTGNDAIGNSASATLFDFTGSSNNTVQGNVLTGTASIGIHFDATSNTNNASYLNKIISASITTPVSDSGSGNNAISVAAATITGQAAASGNNCLQIDTSGVVTKTGSGCGASSSPYPLFQKYAYVAETNSTPVASITAGPITVSTTDLLVAFCRTGSTGTTSITVTDTLANTWTPIGSAIGTNPSIAMAWTKSTSSGSDSFTCTPNATAAFQSAIVVDYQVQSVPTLHTSAFGAEGTNTMFTSGTFSTTVRTLAIACWTGGSGTSFPQIAQIGGSPGRLRAVAASGINTAADAGCADAVLEAPVFTGTVQGYLSPNFPYATSNLPGNSAVAAFTY